MERRVTVKYAKYLTLALMCIVATFVIRSVQAQAPATVLPNGQVIQEFVSNSQFTRQYQFSALPDQSMFVLAVSKDYTNAPSINIVKQGTNEAVASIKMAVNGMCLRLAPGTTSYNLNVVADYNDGQPSDMSQFYSLLVVSGDPSQLLCPADDMAKLMNATISDTGVTQDDTNGQNLVTDGSNPLDNNGNSTNNNGSNGGTNGNGSGGNTNGGGSTGQNDSGLNITANGNTPGNTNSGGTASLNNDGLNITANGNAPNGDSSTNDTASANNNGLNVNLNANTPAGNSNGNVNDNDNSLNANVNTPAGGGSANNNGGSGGNGGNTGTCVNALGIKVSC